MRGSALLEGNDTTPGCHLTDEEKRVFSEALVECKKYGLDFYPTIIQKVRYDEMSEIAAYGGFPHRYPHWYWGMQYEELQRGYEYNQHRIYELVVNCCGFATKVLTDCGSKKVSDVVIGDKVMGTTGWRNVIAVKKQPPSSVYKLKFNDLAGETICTPNHKWLCVRDGQAVWVKAEHMVDGEVVLAGTEYNNYLMKSASLNWSFDKVLESTRPNIRNRLLPICPPKNMTIELAELMGIFTGDGTCGVRLASNIIAVPVHKPLIKYKNHVFNLITKVFGREPKVYEKKQSVDVVTLCSKFAVDFLDFCGWKKGSTYKTKRIPWSIWASSNEFRAAYLRGLFDTDGHCSRYLAMNCFTDELAQDVQLLLLEMGIRSRVTRVKNKNNDIAVLCINGKCNIRKFAKYIGFVTDYKQKALLELAKKDGRSGRSYPLPGVMNEIVKRIKSIDRPTDCIYKYGRRSVLNYANSNGIYGFLYEVVNNGYEEVFGDLLKIAEQPAYVLSNKEIIPPQETIDIALDHDDHDFLANGLITHNTNPCVMYIMASNTMLDNVTVVFHATGHNDFFKNNIFFTPTDENMMNKLSSNAARIRKYIARWGREKVTEFIDHILRIQTLIDPAKAWTERVIREPVIKDRREYEYPRRLRVAADRLHMDPWINPKSFIDNEYKKIEENELAKELELFQISDKDIFGFLKDYAHLKPWQQDIISMLYEESMYFSPQRATKTLNEGWASMMDYEFMTRQGFCALGQKTHDMGIVEYAVHKMGVLGGKYSINPYKTGFYLLLDIEERWNKGRFGTEYEECKSMRQTEDWDTKAGLGKQKIFEVRKYYNDVTFINEFFTQDFCNKFEYFEYKHYPNGEWKIESRDAKIIKRKLLQKHVNGGLPDIRIVDPNHRNKNYFLLQHYRSELDDRVLYDPYARSVMTSIYYLWGKDVMLATTDRNNDEFVYVCVGTNPEKDVISLSREDYEKTWT